LLVAFTETTSLLLQHGVVVGNGDALVVTKAFGIRNVWLSSLAELPEDQWLVEPDRKISRNALDRRFIAIDIEKPST
jgi:hypothetical protein